MIYNILDRYKIDLPEHQFFNTLINVGYNQSINSEVKQEVLNFIDLSKNKNVFLDIGAYIGLFSLIFSANNYEDDTKKSYMFEPSKVLNNITEQIISLTNDERIKNNITLEKCFVGKEDKLISGHNPDPNGPEMLFVNEVNYGSFFSNKTDDDKYNMVSVDSYCEQNNISPDIMKIDVEGYEYNVLRGMKKTLKNCNPTIFIEIHRDYTSLYNTLLIDIYNFFINNDYKIYDSNFNLLDDEEKYENIFTTEHSSSKHCIAIHKDDKL